MSVGFMRIAYARQIEIVMRPANFISTLCESHLPFPRTTQQRAAHEPQRGSPLLGSNGSCWHKRTSRDARLESAMRLPAQPVDATQALNLSAGVSNCKVSRGRSFS